MARKPETVFQDDTVRPWLKSKGWKFIKIQQVARIADPDLVGCVNGAYVELELKAAIGSHADKLQIHQLTITNKGNGYGLLVFPENWEQTKDFLVYIAHTSNNRLEIPECLQLPTIR